MTHRRTAAALTAAALGAGVMTALPTAAVAADPPTDGLVVHYALEGSGTTATDLSGNGHDAPILGGATLGPAGLTLDGVDDFVDLPDDLLAGLDAITVAFDVNIDPALSGAYFIYGFGNTDASGVGNGYLFSEGNPLRTTLATGNWTTEQNIQADHNLQRGVWKHVTFTLENGVGVVYEDGVEVARNTEVTITPGDIGNGVTTANYIGRSLYSADPYFRGSVHDFRVYDRALTTAEIDDIIAANVGDALAADVAAFSIGDTSAVAADLTLPSATPGGSSVTWATSDAGVITASGEITRPAADAEPATATLTATLTQRGQTATKDFVVTVLPLQDDQTRAEAIAAALEVVNIDDVRGNLHLPTEVDGATVTWASSDPAVVTATGEVERPAHGEDAAEVVLTATVTVGAATAVRTFTAAVPALPELGDLSGYLFSHFLGEGLQDGEQVYFALSEGNDPLRYQMLNDGEPVMVSTTGEMGLRDPYIIRSPEGDKFYQIATDLRMWNSSSGSWDEVQRTGSRNIVVWESTDLVNWSESWVAEVAPENAGNVWAPEAYYDPTIGAYVVFWASKLYAEDDPSHSGNTHNRMMYATTRDFRTFSEPQIWIDPGYSVIDSTVIEHDGVYYRYTKDERNNTSSTPCSKFITGETSTDLRSTDWDFLAECIGSPDIARGEGPLVFKSNTEERWYMFIDEYGGRGYVPFTTTDLASGDWTVVPEGEFSFPVRFRHGSVLPVTQAEYDALLAAYEPEEFVASVAPVAVSTTVGTAPELPATVTVTYGDGSTGELPVTWDPVAPEQYAAAGEFEVVGHLGDGISATALAVVTVEASWTPPIFVDVSEDHPFYADIRWLADTGLSEGTEVGDETYFLPAAPMSRQAMAAFLYRYAGEGWTPEAGTQSFPDIAPGHPFYVAVEWMAENGYAQGYADGTFRGTAPVSRQATAAFLHRLAGEPEATEPAEFTDVHAGHPFAEAIAWLQEAEITTGYADGSFGTTRPVTRQAMAAFLHRFDTFLLRVDTVAQG